MSNINRHIGSRLDMNYLLRETHMTKYIVNKKAWISKESTGFIQVQLKRNGGWGTLKIADCNRIVDLDINYGDKAEYRDTMKKLNILIDNITLLRDALEEEGVTGGRY